MDTEVPLLFGNIDIQVPVHAAQTTIEGLKMSDLPVSEQFPFTGL